MKRIQVRIGDVFCVLLDKNTKQYFQYIATDSTQLGSHVIKVFTEKYAVTEAPAMVDITNGSISFYVHTILHNGLSGNCWTKVGKAPVVDDFSVWFRSSYDYGDGGKTKVSKNWRVWQINKESYDVGELPPQYFNAEIGLVINPISILYRMNNGHYDFPHYPSYQ